MNTATFNQQRITLLPMPKEKDDNAFWKKRFLICAKLAGCELAFTTPNLPAAERLSDGVYPTDAMVENANMLLTLCMTADSYKSIESLENDPYKAMQQLDTAYATTNKANVGTLERQLYRMTQSNETVEEFIKKDSLQSYAIDQAHCRIQQHSMRGMVPNENSTSAARATRPKAWTVNAPVATVTDKNIAERTASLVQIARGTNSTDAAVRNNPTLRRMRHYLKVLADWIEGGEVPQFTAYATEERALMATPPESVTLHGDSGCSITLVNNTWILEHVTKVSQPITLADGSTIISTHCGQLKIGPISIMAYYVPNLVTNVLSLSQMTEQRCEVLFDNKGGAITLNGEEIVNFELDKGLWHTTCAKAYKATLMNPNMLHEALGLASERTVKQIKDKKILADLDLFRSNTSTENPVQKEIYSQADRETIQCDRQRHGWAYTTTNHK
eukprot:Awhi_evm1s4039